MAAEGFSGFLVSLLGGGMAVGIMNWIREANKERANRATEFLSDQLRLLYGPLYYFCSENESIILHTSKIHQIYKAQYIDIKYAESAQESIWKEADKTIDLSNSYVGRCTRNNTRMVKILNQHYGLIDPDDMEAFQQFRTQVMRRKVEHEVKPPSRVMNDLGPINFFDPDFFAILKRQFLTKTNQLKELRNYSTLWMSVKEKWRRDLAALNDAGKETPE